MLALIKHRWHTGGLLASIRRSRQVVRGSRIISVRHQRVIRVQSVHYQWKI